MLEFRLQEVGQGSCTFGLLEVEDITFVIVIHEQCLCLCPGLVVDNLLWVIDRINGTLLPESTSVQG